MRHLPISRHENGRSVQISCAYSRIPRQVSHAKMTDFKKERYSQTCLFAEIFLTAWFSHPFYVKNWDVWSYTTKTCIHLLSFSFWWSVSLRFICDHVWNYIWMLLGSHAFILMSWYLEISSTSAWRGLWCYCLTTSSTLPCRSIVTNWVHVDVIFPRTAMPSEQTSINIMDRSVFFAMADQRWSK